jgi:hypothetical protein
MRQCSTSVTTRSGSGDTTTSDHIKAASLLVVEWWSGVGRWAARKREARPLPTTSRPLHFWWSEVVVGSGKVGCTRHRRGAGRGRAARRRAAPPRPRPPGAPCRTASRACGLCGAAWNARGNRHRCHVLLVLSSRSRPLSLFTSPSSLPSYLRFWIVFRTWSRSAVRFWRRRRRRPRRPSRRRRRPHGAAFALPFFLFGRASSASARGRFFP